MSESDGLMSRRQLLTNAALLTGAVAAGLGIEEVAKSISKPKPTELTPATPVTVPESTLRREPLNVNFPWQEIPDGMDYDKLVCGYDHQENFYAYTGKGLFLKEGENIYAFLGTEAIVGAKARNLFGAAHLQKGWQYHIGNLEQINGLIEGRKDINFKAKVTSLGGTDTVTGKVIHEMIVTSAEGQKTIYSLENTPWTMAGMWEGQNWVEVNPTQ